MKKILLFALLFVAVTNIASAQDGTLDLSFGTNGVLTFPSPYSIQIGYGLNGEFYVLENQTVGKYSPSGILDNSYGTNGHTSIIPMIIYNITIQPDGKVLAGGITNPASGTNPYDEIVARFNTDGTLDTMFGNQGYITRTHNSQSVDAVTKTVAGENYIAVLGYGRDPVLRTFANDITIYNLAGIKVATLPAGDLYQNLDPSNLNPSSFEFRIAFDNDKVILLTSNHTQGYSSPNSPDVFDNTLVRYNSDGTPDLSFDQSLSKNIVDDYAIYDMIVTSDHKIIYYSTKYHPDLDYTESVLTRVNADGSIDSGFGYNGRQLIANGSSLILQGSKIIAAYFYGYGQLTLTRFNEDGSTDTSFGTNGTSVTMLPFYNAYSGLGISGNRLYVSGQRNTAAFKLIISNNFTCPPAKSVSTDPKKCTAIVMGIDPVFSPAGSTAAINYSLAGVTVGNGTGSVSGTTFNKGITTVTYTLANDPAITCSFTVTVQDNEAPVITNPLAHPDMLWPPNHQMKDIEIHYELSDNCGATAVLSVTSNEPQSSTEAGDVSGDWQIINEHYIKLRAERKGNGTGRTYTITIMATDDSGNKSSKQVFVKVPYNGPGTQEISIKAFPNPTTNEFYLSSPDKTLERVTIKVMNNFGRVVETFSKVSLSNVLKFGVNYPPGIYAVEIFNNSFSRKLILVKLSVNRGRH